MQFVEEEGDVPVAHSHEREYRLPGHAASPAGQPAEL
jgi:hypothetical protein